MQKETIIYKEKDTTLAFYSTCFSGQPDITICIPAYTKRSLLTETLRSIPINNTDLKVELLIIDDYEEAIVPSVVCEIKNFNVRYYINRKNVGMMENWNKLLRFSSSKWVSFLHDDDLLEKNFFKKIKKVLQQVDDRYAYIKASHIAFYKDGQKPLLRRFIKKMVSLFFAKKIVTIKAEYLAALGNAGFIGAPTCGTLINRDIALKIGGFDSTLFPSSDCYFTIELLKAGYNIGKTREILGFYRYEQNVSMKLETIKMFIDDFFKQNAFIGQLNQQCLKTINHYSKEQYYDFLMTFIQPMLNSNNDSDVKNMEPLYHFQNRCRCGSACEQGDRLQRLF